MKSILLVFIFLLLQSCASVKTPDRHYYRLSTINNNMVQQSVQNRVKLAVSDFATTGLLNSRNLLFIDSKKPNEVKQFNFHFWDSSLSKILTMHFVSYLKLISDNEKISKYSYSSNSGFSVKATVRVMEIVYSEQGAMPVVSIDFQVLNSKNKLVFEKSYSSKKSYKDNEIYGLVTSYNALLVEIYNKFIQDVQFLKVDM